MDKIFWFILLSVVISILSLFLRFWLEIAPTWLDVLVGFCIGLMSVYLIKDFTDDGWSSIEEQY
jgi:hypothetical protein